MDACQHGDVWQGSLALLCKATVFRVGGSGSISSSELVFEYWLSSLAGNSQDESRYTRVQEYSGRQHDSEQYRGGIRKCLLGFLLWLVRDCKE